MPFGSRCGRIGIAQGIRPLSLTVTGSAQVLCRGFSTASVARPKNPPSATRRLAGAPWRPPCGRGERRRFRDRRGSPCPRSAAARCAPASRGKVSACRAPRRDRERGGRCCRSAASAGRRPRAMLQDGRPLRDAGCTGRSREAGGLERKGAAEPEIPSKCNSQSWKFVSGSRN